MSDNVVSFPGVREPTEHEALADVLIAFERLPEQFQVLFVNMLADQLPPAHARAVAAMLAQRFPEIPKPINLELE